jgi:predicted metal-dependent hydrolase
MEDIRVEVERLITLFINDNLPKRVRKEIWNGADVLEELTSDAIEDIKEEIWDLIKSELKWSNIIYEIKDKLKKEPDSESESENEEDEKEESDKDSVGSE